MDNTLLIITLIIIIIFLYFNLKIDIRKNNIENFSEEVESWNLHDSYEDYSKSFQKLKFKNKIRDKDLNSNLYPELSEEDLKPYTGDGIFRNVPFKNNSTEINYNMDEGILKNLRSEGYINTYKNEISYDKMNVIVNKITQENVQKINIPSKVINDNKNEDKLNDLKKIFYNEIFINFVSLVNKYFKKLKYQSEYHLNDKRKYNFFKTEIISDITVPNSTFDFRNLIFNISLYKKDKNHHFTFQINCIYNLLQLNLEYKQIDIIGITEDSNIVFNDLTNNNQKYCSLDSNNDDILGLCHNKKNNSEKKSLEEFEKEFNETRVKKFLNDRRYQIAKGIDESKYKCFFKKGFTENTCKAYSFEKKTVGLYDKPCNKNTECPFYKKNKNYPNSRGGCIKGFCEMPKNIKIAGYKSYFMNKKPFCYNCNIPNCIGEKCYTCCEDQKDRRKYPKLKSPDYIFSNDHLERNKSS